MGRRPGGIFLPGRAGDGVPEAYFRRDGFGTGARWRILENLSQGGVYSVTELAAMLGVQVATASAHMIKMRKAGIVVQGKGSLYTLAPGVLAEGEGREVRIGICTLRFGEG